jgi:Nif-specific regulatory protein
VIQDEHASRHHAEIFHQDGAWYIRELSPLNGTRVNGQVIDKRAALVHGAVIGIGKTALRFLSGEETTVRVALPEIPEPEASVPVEIDETKLCKDELTALCQFMSAAVKETDAHALIERALETVLAQTGASVAGFLNLDEGNPLPKVVLPKSAKVDIHLSRKLTHEVQQKRHTIWVSTLPIASPENESLLTYADAICVPLETQGIFRSALHVYRSPNIFEEREVRFCELIAGYLANTLHVLRNQRSLLAENSRLRVHSPAGDEMVGDSAALRKVRERISRFASLPSTVLIYGESGVGKELVARALHRQSPRKDGPLVCSNCASFSASLLESELFGHRKGAFSGADRDHAGLFEQADEGTLFLDEIGELSPECQAKLLRVLDGHGIRPVGGNSEIDVDVRVVAATNRELRALVSAGRFREDLLFRIQEMQIRVPPLREHAEDIPALAQYFLNRLNREWGRHARLDEGALERLCSYSWRGNVRQLRFVLGSAVALAEGDVLRAENLHLDLGTGREEPASLNLEELEKWAMVQALHRSSGNVTKAAEMLGVVRDTFTNKMRKYGIERKVGEPANT